MRAGLPFPSSQAKSRFHIIIPLLAICFLTDVHSIIPPPIVFPFILHCSLPLPCHSPGSIKLSVLHLHSYFLFSVSFPITITLTLVYGKELVPINVGKSTHYSCLPHHHLFSPSCCITGKAPHAMVVWCDQPIAETKVEHPVGNSSAESRTSSNHSGVTLNS